MLGGAGPAAAVPSIGSVDLGSANSGSLGSTGSAMPGQYREDPVELPALRDDITVAKIVSNEARSGQARRLTVDSPALRRTVGLDVLLPADNSEPRPALYMLEGVGAGENKSGWMSNGGAQDFFADKNVNVVLINGGVGSLYTDWDEIDAGVGLHKWETFITEELPPLIDAELHTNGVQSIAGNSMGAQGAMMLAHRNPGLYQGVAAMSGCYSTMDTLGNSSVQWTVTSRNGDPANMWGPIGGPGWAAHDTVLNAESLRGLEIYLSANSGLPGKYESSETPELLERLVIGGGLELASNLCTQVLDAKLKQLKIPATVDYEPTGTHAWAYWEDQLAKAWPVLAKSLGV
nr:alpha/beta hydrolase family protein [Tomitella biformata]